MREDRYIPKFVSIVAIALGCLDLVRAVFHTLVLDYAARNIAGLDLSTPLAIDLLRLLGTFGISNYITGAMLILAGLQARRLALTLLGVIPAAYGLGVAGIRLNTLNYPRSQAAWGGGPMMMVYTTVCLITFVAGLWVMQGRRRQAGGPRTAA